MEELRSPLHVTATSPHSIEHRHRVICYCSASGKENYLGSVLLCFFFGSLYRVRELNFPGLEAKDLKAEKGTGFFSR